MKNCFLFVLPVIFTLTSCNNKFILRKTYYTGKENIMSQLTEIDTKKKNVFVRTKDSTETKSVMISNREHKLFNEIIKNAGITENFCWVSAGKFPEYSYKYEIILDRKKDNNNCTLKPVRYNVYEAFVEISDIIKKKVK